MHTCHGSWLVALTAETFGRNKRGRGRVGWRGSGVEEGGRGEAAMPGGGEERAKEPERRIHY